MRNALRILEQGFLVGALAFAVAPPAVGADTVLYVTDYPNQIIYSVDITTGVKTPVTTTPGPPDSLIFAPNGNIIYTLQSGGGQLESFNGTVNIPLVTTGLGTPGDLTLEPSGKSVLISDILGGRILRYHLDSGVLDPPLRSGLGRVDGLTYDNSASPKLFAIVNQNSVYQIDPVTGNTVKQLNGITCGTLHLPCGLDGITFDPYTGNLWVAAFAFNSLLKIPTDLSTSTLLASGQITMPDGLESDGNGNIFVASYHNRIYQYDITHNTSTATNPLISGLDDLAPVTGLGAQTGYIEICKASDPNHPVTGSFTFTVTPGLGSGPITVPVGQCSGSIQVPSGGVTVTETPVLGVAVSNVTAIAYDELGFQHDELNSWTLPELHALVNVMVGDQDEETLTTFTNYAAPPGLLKLCKVAGDGYTLGQPFMFTVTSGTQRNVYTILAGPPAQGGNCVLAGNFPVNTQVMISETPQGLFFPSGITVNEGQLMACRPSSIFCAIATTVPGITEVTFTNVSSLRKH